MIHKHHTFSWLLDKSYTEGWSCLPLRAVLPVSWCVTIFRLYCRSGFFLCLLFYTIVPSTCTLRLFPSMISCNNYRTVLSFLLKCMSNIYMHRVRCDLVKHIFCLNFGSRRAYTNAWKKSKFCRMQIKYFKFEPRTGVFYFSRILEQPKAFWQI